MGDVCIFSGCDVKKGNIAKIIDISFLPVQADFFSQQQCLARLTERTNYNLDTMFEVLKFQSLALT